MTTQLLNTTLELRDRLFTLGVPLPFALKRRDPKEPGRRKKEQTEDAIYNAFRLNFAKQKAEIRHVLMRIAPERKSLFGYDVDYYMSQFGDEFWRDDAFIAKLARVLVAGSAMGIDIFADLIDLQIDYTLVNEAAAQWALEYAGEMVKLIDAKTLGILRTALSDFVTTPGMTIGDIAGRLPYKDSRSLLIAIDQTTTIYANAEMMAGEALQKEYPDVLVVKTWFTNNDTWFSASGVQHGVCFICEPLNGVTVPIDQPFIGGDGQSYEKPGAHIGCRCWMSTSTRIGEEYD